MRLVVSLLLLAVPIFAQQPPAEGAPRPQRAAPQPPKNLKILKPEEVRATMGAFRTALGVQCNHCHVQGDFASDDNHHKVIARDMMNMTKEINSKFTDGKNHVTCFTCHRGAKEPLTAPAASESAPPPPPPPAPPQQ